MSAIKLGSVWIACTDEASPSVIRILDIDRDERFTKLPHYGFEVIRSSPVKLYRRILEISLRRDYMPQESENDA